MLCMALHPVLAKGRLRLWLHRCPTESCSLSGAGDELRKTANRKDTNAPQRKHPKPQAPEPKRPRLEI